MAPLRARVVSVASMVGTGPSAAAGTTGVPWRKVTWVTAFR